MKTMMYIKDFQRNNAGDANLEKFNRAQCKREDEKKEGKMKKEGGWI